MAADPTPPAAAGTGRNEDPPKRILVVEDEPKVARLVAQGLTRESFVVETVPSGQAAVERVRTATYDLLILDIMLPDLDGFAVCARVRALGLRLPILMLSARHQVEDRVRGLEIGADDYLTKPFDYSELSARVRTLLRRHRPGLEPLVVGDLTLDPVTRVVSRGLRHVDLTPKEFALLEYLMQHVEHAVTRPMIAQRVWDVPWDGLTNVIDVFINHVRKKIELPGETPLLHAVRGVGYVIRHPKTTR